MFWGFAHHQQISSTKPHLCCRPPLCLLLEQGTSVSLDIVDVLLDPCHDLRQGGIDEMHKQMSALGYAMQSGQTEIVDKVGAASLFGNGSAGIGNPDVCGVCSSVDEIRLPKLHARLVWFVTLCFCSTRPRTSTFTSLQFVLRERHLHFMLRERKDPSHA